MKINMKIISLLLIVFFISLSAVSATSDDNQTIATNDNEKINTISDIDNVVEASNNAKTFTDLQSVFWAAKEGDTITLEDDYVYNNDFRSGRTIGIGVDRASLTVDGQGHTIDGNGKSRMLFIDTSYTNMILKNINFVNGYKSDGAGAISCKATGLTIINCTFTNCNGGNLVGGAVGIFANGATITNSTFSNNKVSQSGGAIRIEGDNQVISNNVFTNNKATEKLGGAISALGNNIKVTDNKFTSNVAGRDGGAIDIEGTGGETNGKKNVLSDNYFTGNSAVYGGAVSLNGQDCTISNNEFIKNTATELGGAVRIAGAKTNTGKVTKNKFTGNTAGISGGAIYCDGNGTVISENEFTTSKATKTAGGAINVNGHKTIISNNTINGANTGTVGGAIYLNGNNIQVTGNTIDKGISASNGGAIYLTGSYASIKNNEITNCEANMGGAIFLKGNTPTISENVIEFNTAKASGGAIYLEGATATITSNNFTGNEAGSSNVGGAIRMNGHNAVIKSNNFIRNTANVGYAIYGEGNNPTISGNYYSTEDDNTVRWEATKIKTILTVPAKTYSVIATKTLTATLKDETGKALSSKKVTFVVNGKSYSSNTNAKGVVSVKVTLSKIKSFPVTVKYAGDSIYNTVTKSGTVKITKDKTKATVPNKSYKKSVSAKKLTFTLKTSTNKVLKSKKITFKVNGKTYTAKTNAKGIATVSVKLTKKGTFKFTAKFAGDSTYAAVSKTAKLVIK